MDEISNTESKARLWRTIAQCAIWVGISGLGIFFARPVAARFRMSSPWVLPAIAVGVLTVIVVVTLLVLPRLTARDR